MKKSKFVTGLSAVFISAMALMSCSTSIRAKDGVILTIDGKEYTAAELFEDQKTPAAAEAKFNAVYKVAVRAYFTNEEEGKKEMTEITNNTKIKISEQKATAQSNAATNGTSYAVEWKKILDSNGVEDEQGLYDKFEYELQKEKYENNFYDKNYEALRNGTEFPGVPGVEFTNYLKGKQPYHIKHILVKLASAKSGDSTHAEISPEEAENLAGVIKALARGDSFASVSTAFSEDETAKKNGGSLGIMSRDTSFVNDFKLGIYMYEAFHGSSTKENTEQTEGTYKAKNAKEELFGKLESGQEYKKGTAGYYATKISELEDPTTTQGTSGANIGIGQIPYGVVENLEKYARYDLKNNETVKNRFAAVGLYDGDIAAKYLPRNVLFNKYFNKHNIMVVTSNADHNYKADEDNDERFTKYYDETSQGSGKYVRNTKAEPYRGNNTDRSALPGFSRVAKNGDLLNEKLYDDTGAEITNKQLLRDENGRVILVFRSGTGDSSSNDAYQGIHFVVIERSPFIGLEVEDGTVALPTKSTTLNEYYWHTYPEQRGIEATDKHPTYSDGSWKKTFINYTEELPDEPTRKERADTVKGELKKCDPKLSTYLYQNLTVNGKIQFTDKAKELGIEDSINSWIKMSREANKFDTQKTWNETWQDYYYSLASQVEQRHINDDNTGKLVPEMCVAAFDPANELFNGSVTLKQLFDKGGVFHE